MLRRRLLASLKQTQTTVHKDCLLYKCLETHPRRRLWRSVPGWAGGCGRLRLKSSAGTGTGAVAGASAAAAASAAAGSSTPVHRRCVFGVLIM